MYLSTTITCSQVVKIAITSVFTFTKRLFFCSELSYLRKTVESPFHVELTGLCFLCEHITTQQYI